jgi:hypothetical protein
MLGRSAKNMEVSDYIKDQKALQSNRFRSKAKWIVGAILTVFASIIVFFIYKVEILNSGSSLLNSVGANQTSKDLSRKAQLIKMEEESKIAYGTDVVWIEVSGDQSSILSKICLDYVPRGTHLSFIGTRNGNIKTCVPSSHKEQILNKIKQIEMQNKSQ